MKLVLKDLDKPIVFYLDRNTINGIMKEFKSMGETTKDKTEKDSIESDGLVINSYPNMDNEDIINNEYTYMVNGKIVSTYSTRTNDSLVIKEDNEVRIINGYDNNIYRLEAEYFSIEDKLYSVFPNYKIKVDGSIEKVECSALENLKILRAKQCKVKTM